jgi:hypothetical protein
MTRRELDQLAFDIQKKNEDLDHARKKYEQCADEYYKNNPPFSSKNEIKQNLKSIIGIIGDCVIADNRNLLVKYILNPISKGKVIKPDKVKDYITALESMISNSKNPKLDSPKLEKYSKQIIIRLKKI